MRRLNAILWFWTEGIGRGTGGQVGFVYDTVRRWFSIAMPPRAAARRLRDQRVASIGRTAARPYRCPRSVRPGSRRPDRGGSFPSVSGGRSSVTSEGEVLSLPGR